MGERKMLCHSFGKVVDLFVAVCMLVQEVADMLFHTGGQKTYNTDQNELDT